MGLREERAKLAADLTALDRVAEGRSLTDDEQAKWDTSMARIEQIDAALNRRTSLSEIGDAPAEEVRAQTISDPKDPKLAEARSLAHKEPAAAGGGEQRIAVNEPSPYSPEAGTEARSYFLDIATAQTGGNTEAREALAANARVQWDEATPEQRTMLLSPDADGGHYAPPLNLVNEVIEALRETATIASTLPSWTHPGAASVKLPKVTGNTAMESTAEDAVIPKSQQTLDQVDVYNERIKGSVEASDELRTFSPVSIDQILTADLAAAYVEEIERQLAHGLGHASNELPGLFTLADAIPVAFTAGGDIEQVDFWIAARKAKGLIKQQGKRVATHFAVASRRLTWFEVGVDADGRPLVPLIGAMNALAANGTIHNMQVVESGVISENLGDDTDQDAAVAYHAPDFRLAQGPMRFITQANTPITVAGEVHLKDNVIFALTRDVMFASERRPQSAAVISGTGMALTL